jgi:RHS repeat-associated protein
MVRVIEDPTGQNLATDYVFDTLGNLRKTIQGEQSRYFTYDSLGRLLYAKQPEQEANTAFVKVDSITGNSAWSVKYQYDDNGNIVSTTDARGVSVSATYDNFNRLKLRDYSDATPDVSFYYDGKGLGATVPNYAKGKKTKVTSSVSETRYTSFDNLGKLLTSEQRTPFTDTETVATATPRISTYQYDAFGSLISETYPSGRKVNYEFNQDGEIARIGGTKGTQNTLYANAISYNSAGAMERLRLGNGKWETAKYNERLQVTQIGLGSSATDTSLLKLEFGYGNNTQNNGSMRSQKISFSGLTQPFEQTYVYDDLNRLQSAIETVNNGTTTTWKQTFSYDRFGNRRIDAANTTTIGVSNKVTNPLINTSDNRLKKDQDNDNITDYDYDKTGNLTQDSEGKQFLYDAENHQKEVFANGVSKGKYLYDGEGRRVKKISDLETTIFVYNGGGQLVAEYSTQQSSTPQVSYLTQDHLGSPRIITDNVGKVIARKDFNAFGDETASAQRTELLGYKPEEIRQDYTGYQKDDESGLEFAQARYYNNKHGRFTSVDPLTASASTTDPQTLNRYSYVMNSPYKFTDSLGLLAEGGTPSLTSKIANYLETGRKGSELSDDDIALVEFHIANGSAQYYTAVNSLENATMLGNSTLSNAVDLALKNLETYVQGNIIESNAHTVGTALKNILKKGNAVAQAIASAIINSGIEIQTTTSTTAQTTVASVADLNAAIKGSCISVAGALGYLVIKIPIGEFSNSVSSVAAIESTLIHEGSHALTMAGVISSISLGGSDDKAMKVDEYDAKYAAAKFEVDRGGVYVKHGQASLATSGGLIDKYGKVNTSLIQTIANQETDTMRDRLKNMGVKW